MFILVESGRLIMHDQPTFGLDCIVAIPDLITNNFCFVIYSSLVPVKNFSLCAILVMFV